MAELSFGEKLLIARKQLDLFQYQMAERLGVHPNSITKYERGEGKPHAAVVRMFDLLCEQQGIRFDEYESRANRQGRHDEDRFGREGFAGNTGRICGRTGMGSSDARPVAGRIAGGLGRCRCAGGAHRRAGRRCADGAGAQAARDWPGRSGRGQHRCRSRHAARHCGDEYAGRERGGRGRVDHRR